MKSVLRYAAEAFRRHRLRVQHKLNLLPCVCSQAQMGHCEGPHTKVWMNPPDGMMPVGAPEIMCHRHADMAAPRNHVF